MNIFTEKGLALLKNNGKVISEALKANEKALDEHKWYLHGKTAEGKTRKRSSYVQYLRGKMDALKELADGTELKPWVPDEGYEKPKAVTASANLEAIIAKAVAAALAKAK
jgi:hypothetical protein